MRDRASCKLGLAEDFHVWVDTRTFVTERAVIERLAPTEGVVPVHVTEEDEYFPPPRELRELMHTLDVTAPALFGGSFPADSGGAFTDDRGVDASRVLAGHDT